MILDVVPIRNVEVNGVELGMYGWHAVSSLADGMSMRTVVPSNDYTGS